MNQCPDCLSDLFGAGGVCSACGCVVDERSPAAIQGKSRRPAGKYLLLSLACILVGAVIFFSVKDWDTEKMALGFFTAAIVVFTTSLFYRREGNVDRKRHD